MSNYTKSTNFATKDNLSPGDPLKIVRGTEIDTEFNNISTAISTKTDNSAAAITGGSITGITDLAIADGGTGASTATAALNNLLPSQTGNSSKYLQTDGSNATWDAISINTGDITGTLPVANGGTGITSFGTGIATFLGTPSSANLASAVTDETGSGALVFANTPTLVSPILGTPTSGNFSSGSFTWPTFNQNTTGTAAGLSATLAIASGGSGQTTANAAFNALAPSQTSASGKYLKSDGTNTSWDALDISTADITGTLPIANGGTGATTAGGALTSLGAYAASNPSGYTSNTGTVTSVGGTGTVNGLTLTGTVTTSGNLTLGGTLSGVSLTSQVSGTLPTANGGTNLTSFTSGGVVYASSTSALATGSALTFNGTNLFSTGSITLDTNLGIFFSGLGATTAGVYGRASGTELAFNANGAEGMRLTSTSLYTASGINVGIGTSSPGTKLSVITANAPSPTLGTASGGFSLLGGGGLYGIYAGVSDSGNTWIQAMRNNTATAYELLLQPSGGNVGIGTSSPLEKLHVEGSIVVSTTNNTSNIYLLNSGTTYLQLRGNTTSALINNPTAGPIVFGTTDLERARIPAAGGFQSKTTISVGDATPSASGAGITFPATQSASSDANTLDDYEEGTWTAAFVPSTSGSITMNAATGTYTKVGRNVTINGLFTVTSVSSPLGYFTITGLPFSGGASASKRCALAINSDDMNVTMTTTLLANIQSGSEIYVLKNNGTGGISLTTAADVKAGTVIFIGGTYITD